MDVFREIFEDLNGDIGARELRETMTRSDLPYLLAGEAFDRALLAEYREYPADWVGYTVQEKTKDFRTAERLMTSGGDGVLSEVKEQAPYPYAAIDEDKWTFRVKKMGRKFGLSWEALKNDDLGAFRRLPNKLARAARRTEQRRVTELFCHSGGINTTDLFKAHASSWNNGSTDPLNIESLTTAFNVIGTAKDSEGEPIYFEAVHLVVPPSLEITARNIINAIEISYPLSTTTANQQVTLRVNNWIKNRIQLHVNPYIPIVNTTNGSTNWFLFPDPNDVEILVFARLMGHEEPEIFMKDPNAIRIGGGSDPFAGDFEHDSIDYKLRHCFGTALGDYLGCYGSTGAG